MRTNSKRLLLNGNFTVNKLFKSFAFYQFFRPYIQYKGTVGLFQHIVNFVDSYDTSQK